MRRGLDSCNVGILITLIVLVIYRLRSLVNIRAAVRPIHQRRASGSVRRSDGTDLPVVLLVPHLGHIDAMMRPRK
jgi:hypothetical protein